MFKLLELPKKGTKWTFLSKEIAELDSALET
jgi:hypothetical protein